MAREAQQTRHWRLLQLLESRRGGLTIADLERELGVSYRTIYRDLRAMEDAGLPLYQDEREGEKVWRLLSRGAPVPFTTTEMLGVYLARDALAVFRGTPVHDAVDRLLTKVRASLSERSLAHFDALRTVYRVSAASRRRFTLPEKEMAALNRALLERTTVRIAYRDTGGARTAREVEPYLLWFREESAYLVAYCRLRRSLRTFALDRVTALEPLGRPFRLSEDFDPEAIVGDAFGVIRGKPTEVVVRFEASVAAYVAERVWEPHQKMEWETGGRLRATLHVGDPGEFRHWVLGFGPKAEVLAPPELRAEVVSKLRTTLSRYEE